MRRPTLRPADAFRLVAFAPSLHMHLTLTVEQREGKLSVGSTGMESRLTIFLPSDKITPASAPIV